MANQPLGQMIIELGLDSSTFATGMSGVNQQLKTSMTEMKAHLNIMGRSGNEVDMLKAKQTGLTSVIESQNKKVELAKEKYEACKKEVEGNSEATQKQKDALIKAQNEYVKAVGELGSYENQLKEVTIKLTAMESSVYKVGTSLESIGKKIANFGQGLTDIGKKMTAGITTPLVGLGTAAIKVTADFEAGMSQVQATMGLTKDSMSSLEGQSVNTMDALGALAKQMGAETKFSATEAASAINNLAMAGYDTQQIYDALPQVLALASAGSLDLDYACQLSANGLNVMGLEVKDLTELSDKMAVTASSAYGSVSDFGEGLLSVGNQASLCNVNLTDTYTALGILGDNGYQASEGGTMLRNVLKNLYTPTDAARKALDELGIQTADSNGNLIDLQDVLQSLGISMDGLSANDRVNMMNTIFDTKTIAGANALLKECGGRWDELSDAIEDSAGAAQDMADTQLDNLSGQLVILKSATEAIGISFGEIMLPAIKSVVSGIQGLADWLNNLDEKQKQTIVRVAAVAAVTGPVVLIVGKLVTGIGNLTTKVGKGMVALANWAAKITTNATVTTASTAATNLNTAANTKNTAGLMARTVKVIANNVATKASAVADSAWNLLVSAGNGTLTAQVVALNASIISKTKSTVATVAHTVAEKARNLVTGAGIATTTGYTAATAIQTVATTVLTGAVGLLSAAFKLLTGPIGWITAGVGALVVGITALVKWFNKESEASKQLKAQTEELAIVTDKLTGSTEESEKAYKESEASIKAESGAAKSLVRTIQDLSAVENKSAAQKQELAAYIDMLNGSVDGLNLQYDEQTDALNMTTDAIYTQIKAFETQAQKQVAQERLTEILKERIVVNEQLVQVQDKITEAENNTSLSETERKKVVADLTEQQITLTGELDNLASSHTYVTGEIEKTTAAEAAATAAMEAQKNAAEEHVPTILEAYGTLANAYEDLGECQQNALDGILSAYETMTGSLTDLTSMIKRDSELTWGSVVKTQDNVISETEIFSELYSELISAGVSGSWLAAIGANKVEAIPLLREMQNLGIDEIYAKQGEWENAWTNTADKAVDGFQLDGDAAAAIKDYVMGESGVFGTLKDAIVAADFNSLGVSVTEGISLGILKSTDNAVEAVTDLTDATVDAGNDGFEINSPSKKFMRMGEGLIEGLALGVTNSQELMSGAFGAIVPNAMEQINKIVTSAMPNIAKSFATGFSGAATSVSEQLTKMTATVNNSLTSIVSTVTSKMNSVKTTVNTGFTTVVSNTTVKMASMKNSVNTGFTSINSSATSGMNAFKTSVTSGFNGIQSTTVSGMNAFGGTITSGLNTATAVVSAGANGIVSAMNIKSEMYSSGVYAMQGLESGLISGSGAVYARANSIANNVARTMSKALDINSPSRVLMALGKYAMEGFGIGIEKMAPFLESVTEKASNIVTSGLNMELDPPLLTDNMIAIQSMSNAVRALDTEKETKKDNSIIEKLLENAIQLLAELKNSQQEQIVILDDGTLVGRVVDKVDYQLGKRYERRERG